MPLDISPYIFSTGYVPQMNHYDPKKAAPSASGGDTSAKKDTVDLTSKIFNRETRYEMDMQTKKVTVKVVNKDTNEVIRQISDKGVLSGAAENNVGAVFHGATV